MLCADANCKCNVYTTTLYSLVRIPISTHKKTLPCPRTTRHPHIYILPRPPASHARQRVARRQEQKCGASRGTVGDTHAQRTTNTGTAGDPRARRTSAHPRLLDVPAAQPHSGPAGRGTARRAGFAARGRGQNGRAGAVPRVIGRRSRGACVAVARLSVG